MWKSQRCLNSFNKQTKQSNDKLNFLHIHTRSGAHIEEKIEGGGLGGGGRCQYAPGPSLVTFVFDDVFQILPPSRADTHINIEII